jgi:cytochrome c oxidase subunit 3
VLPKILWVSTAVILISSVTIELARRSLKQDRNSAYRSWLVNTVVLGGAFVVTQLLAWRQLVKQGVYLASNPYNSFFYLLTAAHGVHLVGGLAALTFLMLRTTRKRDTLEGELRRVGAAEAATIYWHFMDALWVGLFLLLMFWR